MAVLDASDHLIHEVASHTVQNPLEERLVVVQLERKLELELKVTPNCMVFPTTWRWS